MAETSGFSTDLPQSAYLAHTIGRAISAAEQRSHRYVTLEHLLLALLDDTDALALMEVARTDIAALRSASTETVNHSLATLYTPGTFDLHASYKVERVLQSASDDARRMGCTEVDGAFVAVALFHETDSPAYDLLKRHNFVFHAANSWLDRNRRPARPRYAPPVVDVPEPEPVVVPPTAWNEAALIEPDEEMLLEEVSDEDDEAFDSPSSPRPATTLPPFFQQQIGKSDAASPRPSPRRDLREFNEAGPATRREIETAIQDARPMARQQSRPDLAEAELHQTAELGSHQTKGSRAGDADDLSVFARNSGLAARGSVAPALRQDSRRVLRPMLDESDDEPMLEPVLPSRSSPDRRPIQTGMAPADLGSAVPARELSPPQGRDLGSAPRHSDAAPIIPGRQPAEQRPASVLADNARAEPRLSTAAAERSRGLGSAVPARGAPGIGDGHDLRPQIEPPSIGDPSQDLGLAVPAREPSSPGRSAEPGENRPLRPHASARERSTSVRPPAPASAGASAAGESAPAQAKSATRAPGAERRAPQSAPVPAGPRPDQTMPPAGRLDDMRVRPTSPAAPVPAPAPVPTPGKSARKSAAAPKDGDKARTRRRPTAGSVYTGKLAENIPRRMKAFKPERIEVRVTREETETFLAGMEGSPEAFRHDLLVTQAMSVLLRAPDGGFTIESIAPETQWIFNRPGIADKEPFGRWRWSVTPTETGPHRLQLVVAARSVDQNGLPGDTPLPDQVVTVTTRVNYSRSLAKALRWVVLMALGGAITEAALQVMRLLTKG